MDDAGLQLIEEWFAEHRGKSATLILAGRIFGGRYGESPQTPQSYHFESDTLQITFDATELLTIRRPKDAKLGRGGSLLLSRAEFVSFGWHSYGRPQTAENWCQERYELDGNVIHFERAGPLLPTSEDIAGSRVTMVELAPD